jgi:hypothetical protein
VTINTKKKDKFLRKELYGIPLRAEIVIEGKHNHHLHCADTLRKNRVSDELVAKFNKMFDDGCTPAQAKKLHSDQLLSEEAYIDLADNKVNPTSNTLYHLHKKWMLANHGGAHENPIDKIQQKIASGYYQERGNLITSKFY